MTHLLGPRILALFLPPRGHMAGAAIAVSEESQRAEMAMGHHCPWVPLTTWSVRTPWLPILVAEYDTTVGRPTTDQRSARSALGEGTRDRSLRTRP